MSLISHARVACVRETILDTKEIMVQANSYQMVMAYLAEDVKAELTGSWEHYLQEFKWDLIEAERTKLQNLMIGGLLFKQATRQELQEELQAEIQILEKELK